MKSNPGNLMYYLSSRCLMRQHSRLAPDVWVGITHPAIPVPIPRSQGSLCSARSRPCRSPKHCRVLPPLLPLQGLKTRRSGSSRSTAPRGIPLRCRGCRHHSGSFPRERPRFMET